MSKPRKNAINGLPSVAICTIVRNENPYLVEWLAWYRMQGVFDVYLYDNVSTDGTSELLMQFQQTGLARRVFWPRDLEGNSPQNSAYRDFVMRFAHDYDFVGFLDADEFAIPSRHHSIPAMLASLPESHGALYLHWRVFGSSGELAYRDAPVIERFTMAASIEKKVNRWGKTFARTSDVVVPTVHHCAVGRRPYQIDDTENVLPEGKVLDELMAHDPSWNLGKMIHYACKSREEYDQKAKRGRAAVHKSIKRPDSHFLHYNHNDEEDLSAKKHLPEVEKGIDAIEERLSEYRQTLQGAHLKVSLMNEHYVSGWVRSTQDVMIRVLVDDQKEVIARGRISREDANLRHFLASFDSPLPEGATVTIQVWGSRERLVWTVGQPECSKHTVRCPFDQLSN